MGMLSRLSFLPKQEKLFGYLVSPLVCRFSHWYLVVYVIVRVHDQFSFPTYNCLPLIQVEREKMKTEEIASKSAMERGSLDRTLQRLDDDNQDLQKQVQQLQAQLAEAEQQHAQRYAGSHGSSGCL